VDISDGGVAILAICGYICGYIRSGMKIGIRELKNRAPQVVREVRESGETAEITYRGEVVAWLTPAEAMTSRRSSASAWRAFDEVVSAIGARARARKKPRTADWRRDV
jgi:prevent-host-death family protein